MFGCIYGCAKYWTSFVLMLNMKLRSSSSKICLPAAPRLNNSSQVSPHKIKQPTDKSSNKSAAFSWLFSLFLSSCVQYIHIFNCKYFIIVCYCPCGNLLAIGNTGGFLAIALNIFTFGDHFWSHGDCTGRLVGGNPSVNNWTVGLIDESLQIIANIMQ